MTIVPLYRIEKDGYVIVSVYKPEGEYTEKIRLVADEGKVLTKDGENFYSSMNMFPQEQYLWHEVDEPIFEEEEPFEEFEPTE